MDDVNRQLIKLLDRSGAKLYTLLTRITLSQDIAQELLQELFVKLIEISKTSNIENWDAYARTTAVNLAFTWRRRHKTCGVSLDNIAEPISENEAPLASLIAGEQIQEVLGAIGQLNGSARQAFVMRHIQQDSYENIAAHLGKTPQQVRAVCSSAMKYLRMQLGPKVSADKRKDAGYD